MLTKASEFPQPGDDVSTDFCFMYCQGNRDSPHWLVYETERDFLSAPRTFVIAQLLTVTVGAIELDSLNEYDGVLYDERGNMAETGIFWVQGSDGNDRHMLISLPSQRIELLVQAFELKAQVIAVSARMALAQFLVDQKAESVT